MLRHAKIHPAMPSERRHTLRGPLALVGALIIGGALALRVAPALAADGADALRTMFGPTMVGQIEAVTFQGIDLLHQAEYQWTSGAHGALQWADAPARSAPIMLPPTMTARTAPPITQPLPSVSQVTGLPRHAAKALPRIPPTPAPATPVPATTRNDAPWAPFVPGLNGAPVLWRALVSPDPSRPYARAALVRFDLQRAQLHLVAGTIEPVSPVHITRPGVIPANDRQAGKLLAAFNGGFKAISGAYGMAVGGTTLLPPQDGLATLAFYRDGSIRLGVWGQDITVTPDLVAYRQNCPLLISGGTLTPEAAIGTPDRWGKTVGNKIATWRSGLGLSADRRWMYVAVGDGLTVDALGQALIWAGADQAMQLDINSYWTRFDTFVAQPDRSLVAQKLLDAMPGDTSMFLTPDTRDFFYVTAR